jgi:hypothetical protein
MSISDRTRKSLWAKSGNRCSICKVELLSNKNDSKELNLGEECHIISSKINGPRYKPNIVDYDIFDNLILLCRNHHREIDELTATYTEDVLMYMKLNHEEWVKTILNNALNSEKKNRPRFINRITSGKELLNIISDNYGYIVDYDEVENEKDAEYIGGVLQSLVDYGEISGMVEIYDKVKIGLELQKLLNDIEEKGYYLFGEKDLKKLKFDNGDKVNWSISTLIIKKKDNSEIVKVNLDDNKSYLH